MPSQEAAAWKEVLADSYCAEPVAYVEAELSLGELALKAGDVALAKQHAAAARGWWVNPDPDLTFTKRLVALESAE
jgi:hypothetical protein